ncbi:hypothetical protein BGW36DRAFT_323591 [Talaromyces proteolyticus]|uniref:J domain-containing protein n=1 Tax=Talaromyces proteolyticus TaxID=1131652 RepID=A0AAD4KIS8_9EURO|nr:uncharacterized protein BGW36DRAFT_323591 [Talaromyces proteolyticus]KAH8693540.1 hypothetical protein BGW36DRAFT_323591 [Talaromyces proteolyticus]
MRHPTLQFLVLALLLVMAAAWTKEDHEIFQLRDEILAHEGANVTFYDFLGVKATANQDDINKAYRKKAKQLHPDKVRRSFIANNSRTPRDKTKGKKPGVHVSKGPSERQISNAVKEANDRAARLNVAANILRGPSRERYDHFLNYGFPKWKGTGYYYSRFRPGLGSVLLGLFLVFGGAGHYAALVLSWKRQREFMHRYIRHARKAAWGDERGLGGIPGLDPSAATHAPPPPPSQPEEAQAVAMNRRQKRMMDRENRKENKKGVKTNGREAGSGTATPTSETVGAVGNKRRVYAENGKVLVVDSVGNVFLEEETEDGEKQEFLLDVDEIPRPQFRDTVVFRLPVWIYHKTVSKITGGGPKSEDDDSQDVDADTAQGNEEVKDEVTSTATSTKSAAKKRGKRSKN